MSTKFRIIPKTIRKIIARLAPMAPEEQIQREVDNFIAEELKPFPEGLHAIPDRVTLYRLIMVKPEDVSKINTKKLGKHWVADKSLFYDHHFMDTVDIGYYLSKGRVLPVIIEAIFRKDDINWYKTLYQRLTFEHEREIRIKENVRPLSFKINTDDKWVKMEVDRYHRKFGKRG